MTNFLKQTLYGLVICVLLSVALILVAPATKHAKAASGVTTCQPSVNPACVCSSQGCIIQGSNPNCENANPTQAQINQCLQTNPLVERINQIVNFLSAGVGIVVVGVIIVGGIQYSIAGTGPAQGNNPTAIRMARKRITNGLIALVAFMLIYTFIQWLIPGGLFK